MAEQKQWRSEIQHGPDGETDYAWVHDDKDALVCVAGTNHAHLIVTAVNTYPAVEGLVKALEDLVKINEQHDDSISKIIGKPVGWKDNYLDNARSALSCFRSLQNGGVS